MRGLRCRGEKGGARYKIRLIHSLGCSTMDPCDGQGATPSSTTRILHGRYLHRLSHESMILYLFLVVVGDRQGRSFYSDQSITEILRLTVSVLQHAREELISEALISYRRPYWKVKNIAPRRYYGRDDKRDDSLSSRRPGTELLSDPRPDRDFAKACLTPISKILSGEKKEDVHTG